MKPITLFFGDGEHPLLLTSPMIRELERKLTSGIGATLARFQGQTFTFDDLTETIRCGLIGGGMAPQQAHDLARIYVDQRPFFESYQTAYSVLLARFAGTDEDADPEAANV